MTPEKHRAHAHLARQLIRACGGLAEAAKHCSLEKSRLQEFTDPKQKAVMTWQVIDELEEHSGREGLYAGAIAAMGCSADLAGGDLQDEACELSEVVLRMQGLVRGLKGLAPTNAQKDEACQLLLTSEQSLRRLHHDIERGQP